MSTAMLDAITSSIWQPVIFIQLTFTTGPVYISSLYQAVTTDAITGTSQTWIGLGSLLSIGNIEDGATVDARGTVVTVSGIDPTLLPDIENDVQLGLPVTIWLGALSSGAIVVSPVILWSGGMDQPAIQVGGDEITITIDCEDLLVSMNVAVDRRYTPQDQQLNWGVPPTSYSGGVSLSADLGFQFVDAFIETTIQWGTQATVTPNI